MRVEDAELLEASGYGSRPRDFDDLIDPLRDRDDFLLLMIDLAMPAEPFN